MVQCSLVGDSLGPSRANTLAEIQRAGSSSFWRNGEIGDIFAVPQAELTVEQLAKSPLLESEIEWGRLSEHGLGQATPQLQEALREVKIHFQKLAGLIPQSARATANLAHWNRIVNVQTGGGNFSFAVEKGKLRVQDESAEGADLVLSVKDPAVLLAWLRDSTEGIGGGFESPALTDLVVEGTLQGFLPVIEGIAAYDGSLALTLAAHESLATTHVLLGG
jgi:hypothetical protein